MVGENFPSSFVASDAEKVGFLLSDSIISSDIFQILSDVFQISSEIFQISSDIFQISSDVYQISSEIFQICRRFFGLSRKHVQNVRNDNDNPCAERSAICSRSRVVVPLHVKIAP